MAHYATSPDQHINTRAATLMAMAFAAVSKKGISLLPLHPNVLYNGCPFTKANTRVSYYATNRCSACVILQYILAYSVAQWHNESAAFACGVYLHTAECVVQTQVLQSAPFFPSPCLQYLFILARHHW